VNRQIQRLVGQWGCRPKPRVAAPHLLSVFEIPVLAQGTKREPLPEWGRAIGSLACVRRSRR
jgi:hypothetical protein